MSLQAVDWSRFAGDEGGHRFERFCADLLGAQGYSVEHMAKGGNDEGKDLLILQQPKSIAGSPPTVLCLVECKSRTTKDRKAISLEDISRSLWALFENNCACLVLFTTHKFNSQAVNCFLRVNERGQLKISWIDQDDLIEMGRRHPGVWRSHLQSEPPGLAPHAQATDDFRVFGQARGIVWGDDEPLGVVMHNTGPVSGRARLRRNGVVIDEVVLDHHQRVVLSAPASDQANDNPYNGLTASFQPSGAGHAVERAIQGLENIETRRRVDHLFADPANQRARILKALNSGKDVHLRGGAGCGKSRLLTECLRTLSHSLAIDLSRDDEDERLLDALVQRATGWPANLLAKLPEGLVDGLSKSAGCDPSQLRLVADYCAERVAHPTAAVARALISLTSKALRCLVVDNIQEATNLDEAILQEALSAADGPACLLTTRTDGVEFPARSARILRAASTRPLEFIQDDDQAERLASFVQVTAVDEATASCFSTLIRDASFQTWVSKLKALRQLGTLQVEEDGRLRLLEQPDRIDLGSYARLQELILFSRLPDKLHASCAGALQAGSVFGEVFPVSFVESLLGEKGIEALDELERRELIKGVAQPSLYGLCFRFDHALTRNAVMGTIPSTKRAKLHEAAARFVESWSEFQPGASHYEMAMHYRSAGRVMAALSGYEAGAQHYLNVGRVGSAQTGLLAGLPLFDELPIDRNAGSIARELHARELLLESALLVPLPEDVWERQIEAFQIQTHLFPGVPGFETRLGRSHCFNACFDGFRRRVPTAWREMQKALQLLEGMDDPLPLAEALKWGSNLQKNLGAYDRAALMATRAYDIYLDRGHERLAGEAATELSHVFYEAHSFDDALVWGRRALEHYGAVGHPSLVARARVDIARMLAMLRPADPTTCDELELAVRLGRHAGIGSQVAKALMNLGIYLALEKSDHSTAAARFTDAEQILRIHPNAYVGTLLQFVQTGLFLGPKASRALRTGQLGKRLVALCRHFESPDQIGDRRMQMMLKALSAAGNDSVLDWLERFGSSNVAVYARIGLGRKFVTLEASSPLFRQNGFALYY
jgi:tetratricopeptide (TPR) repeat protein